MHSYHKKNQKTIKFIGIQIVWYLFLKRKPFNFIDWDRSVKKKRENLKQMHLQSSVFYAQKKQQMANIVVFQFEFKRKSRETLRVKSKTSGKFSQRRNYWTFKRKKSVKIFSDIHLSTHKIIIIIILIIIFESLE